MTEMSASADKKSEEGPTAPQLFFVFARIALTSFGGGLSGWFMRVFVEDKKWISEEEFLNGLALSQALPGINVKNLAIWIGYRLRGFPGALAGFFGTILPSAILVVLIGTVFSSLTHYDSTHVLLTGAAAAAIGLSFSMGISAVRRLPRRLIPFLVMIATFVAITFLHWPLGWTVLALGVFSVAFAYVRN